MKAAVRFVRSLVVIACDGAAAGGAQPLAAAYAQAAAWYGDTIPGDRSIGSRAIAVATRHGDLGPGNLHGSHHLHRIYPDGGNE